VDKAIKVIEECDLEPLATEQREYRETDVRNTLGRIDGWKRYEKAKPSAAAEKAYFLGRARNVRQAAAILRDEQFSEELIAGVLEAAAKLEHTAATYVVQRHKPQPSRAKEFAVMEAWWLLTTFRNWHPGVTRGGHWQRLASILFGGRGAIGIEQLQKKRVKMRDETDRYWAEILKE
jgi:hypothetical protein